MKLQVNVTDVKICIEDGCITIKNVTDFKVVENNAPPIRTLNQRIPLKKYQTSKSLQSYNDINVGDVLRCVNAEGQNGEELCLREDNLYIVTRLFKKRGKGHASIIDAETHLRCGTAYHLTRFVKCC